MRSRVIPSLSVVLLATALSGVADGAPQPIAAVEVSTQVAREGRDMRAVLKTKVETQLQSVDWSKSREGGPYVLSTSLVRLDTDTSEGATKVTCAVSMTLRDQKRGVLRAIVQGRAHSEDRAESALAAEDEALQVAVRSAARSLPEAILRSR
jgi:hypothetical protein